MLRPDFGLMVDHDEEQREPVSADLSWRGLGGLFDSSYSRLDPTSAEVFRRLGLHPEPEFGTDAVAVLTMLERPSVTRVLDKLANEHLVEQVAPDRYRMHPVLHDYAAHRAELDEEPVWRQQAVGALLGWYAAMADLADRLVYPVSARLDVVDLPLLAERPSWDREEALKWLRSERVVLSAAQRMAVDNDMHGVVVSLALSSRHLGLGPRAWWEEMREATSRGVDAARLSGDSGAEALLRVLLGHCHRSSGDLAAAEAEFQDVLESAERADDRVLRRRALAGLAGVYQERERYDEAAANFLAMLDATRQEGNSVAEAIALGNLCLVNVALGRFEEALDYAQQAWVLRSRTGDPLITAYADDDRALAWQGLGEHETAIALWNEVVAVYGRHSGAEPHLAKALEAMADSLSAVGRHDQAGHGLRWAADILADLQDPRAGQVRQRAGELAAAPADGSGGVSHGPRAGLPGSGDS